MQFFRPWGRDFVILRSVNKRFNAAYQDHLKLTVNIGDYLATVDQKVLAENEEQLKTFFNWAVNDLVHEIS